MPEYQRQLQRKGSDAKAHLARMTKAVRLHEKTDPAFLHSNFAVDTDYFDLQPLATVSTPKKGTP